MKKLIILILVAVSWQIHSESILRNWESYTNTTHVSDIEVNGDLLLISTWGGLLQYDTSSGEFTGPLKMEDGLTEHELSSVVVYADSVLLAGSKGGGINRIKDKEILMPLDQNNGIASNDIYALETFGDKYVAITGAGISVFSELPVWPLPSVQNFDMSSGLSTSEYTSIGITDSGLLLCGSELGIDYTSLNSAEQEWFHLDGELSGAMITSISTKGNSVAIGTRSGIYFTENFSANATWQMLGESEAYFPVYLATSGDIWAGKGWWNEAALMVEESGEEVIIRFGENDDVETWTKDDLNLDNSMITCLKDFNGGLVAGIWGQGMIIYDGIAWGDAITQSCVGVNFVTELAIDRQHRLWTGNGTLFFADDSRANRGVSVFDGFVWDTYRMDNSGLGCNNINSIEVIDDHTIWFTAYTDINSDHKGVTRLDYSNPDSLHWEFTKYTQIPLPVGEIGHCELARDGNVWLTCYNTEDDGTIIVDKELNILDTFTAPDVMYQGRANSIFSYQAENYVVMGGRLSGFEIWNSSELPDSDLTEFWLQPDNSDFRDGQIFAAAQRDTYFDHEIWIATSIALYMFDGDDWFRYGKDSTKRQYLSGNGVNMSWQPEELIYGENDSPDWWYFEGQERLYGGENTYPTALLVDPFNNLWIGTASNGICRYDIENNLFKTYNTDNSELLADKINDLIYDELTGRLYIATDRGLNSVEIGFSQENNPEQNLNKVVVYPNPFRPETDGITRIENIEHLTMPQGGTTCNIYDLTGFLVKELELNNFQQFEWDGKNASDKNCSSGLYFYVVTTSSGKTARGKVILIR